MFVETHLLICIINCILKEIGVINDNNYDLEEGVLVRYVLEKNTFTKVRHKISVGANKIDSMEGNNYIIIAKDGSTKKLPHCRIVTVSENENIPLAPTLEEYNANRGVIEEIFDYNPKKRSIK